jgi:hypothetical protein
MPSGEVTGAYREARERHENARREFVHVLERMAVETIAEVLPGASLIEAVGELNEDWVPTLRVLRVLRPPGEILFDVEAHVDRNVEDAVDVVNVEYLDVLIDLTGDDYMGSATIG